MILHDAPDGLMVIMSFGSDFTRLYTIRTWLLFLIVLGVRGSSNNPQSAYYFVLQ